MSNSQYFSGFNPTGGPIKLGPETPAPKVRNSQFLSNLTAQIRNFWSIPWNVKLSNSQLNKLKSGIKNSSEVTLNLSSNVIDDSNDESNCPCKLLLADRQTSKVHKSFENNFWGNMKLSKTQLSKIVPSAGFLGRFLRPLRRAGSQLGNNVLIPVAKIVVISLGLMATADAAIQNKFLELGMTTLVISNK